MPTPKRWHPVSRDLNEDPELWAFTDQFGDRSLRLWLEILSLIDRHENHWDRMIPLTRTSRRFYESVKLSDKHAHELAAAVGLDATLLSLVINGHRKVRLNDPRLLKLGKLVGLKPAEIFDPVPTNGA